MIFQVFFNGQNILEKNNSYFCPVTRSKILTNETLTIIIDTLRMRNINFQHDAQKEKGKILTVFLLRLIAISFILKPHSKYLVLAFMTEFYVSQISFFAGFGVTFTLTLITGQ